MIEVRFSTQRLERFGNPVLAGVHILEGLRDAGVPATGVLYVVCAERAERGVLEVEVEEDLAGTDDVLVYRWRE